MTIKAIEAAVVRLKSQKAVADKLGIKPQRLNNWLRAGKVPAGWEWNLAERLRK
jgi:DNA-binding transcriptional regulator YdaS (Cro superfamily)